MDETTEVQTFNREKLSVLLPTYNNAELIRDCLESVKWADEILVVDSFSTDETPAICREYGARVIQRAYDQSANQKNWAIPQCAHAWVLQIDTDERLEPGLHEEIEQALHQAPPDVDGYWLPFKHHVLGQWVRECGLYPEYHLRLFRKAAGRFQDREVHAHLEVPGQVATLRRHILHYGMPYITKQLSNLDRYSRYQADQLKKQGKRFHWYQLILRPVVVFLYYYFWKRGFRAGYRGLLLAASNATFDFWAHAKLWELTTLRLKASPK
ncbi:(heptosyl)LPS beta-1,4-glucosyltransferase [Anaerolineae bacterium]|nr:(heptosyl)LPS beta-1,4-glucosyltransferase [Anaerolineae bacterium]